MKNLSIREPRCRGVDTAPTGAVCPQRNRCGRHLQLERDRQLELPPTFGLRVYHLPRVAGQACTYFLPEY